MINETFKKLGPLKRFLNFEV